MDARVVASNAASGRDVARTAEQQQESEGYGWTATHSGGILSKHLVCMLEHFDYD